VGCRARTYLAPEFIATRRSPNEVVGQFEEIGIGIELEFGHGLLRETGFSEQAEQG
jgi:hypothetical protein